MAICRAAMEISGGGNDQVAPVIILLINREVNLTERQTDKARSSLASGVGSKLSGRLGCAFQLWQFFRFRQF
jgi:hypothetical protein